MNKAYLVLDSESAIERMGDKEIYIEIAHCFADNLDNTLASLAGALDAADMENATRFAHSLKGNCSTVGAEELRQSCLLLEQTCRRGEREEALRLFGELRPKLSALRAVLRQLQ